MRVAGIQFDVAWEDPPANFRRVEELARGAADEGARLIVLSEMFATGFTMKAREMAAHAEPTKDFLRGLAAKLDVAVLGGLVEPGRERPANAAWAFAPDGATLAHFRKLHPFTLAREQDHYEAGDEIVAFSWEGVRVAPFICYDLRFPEPFRAAAPEVDLMAVLASWPARRGLAWRSLLLARAIENQAYVLGVNRVGLSQGMEHGGDSMLIGPMGESLASLSWEEGLVAGEVDPRAVFSARQRFSFLLDRRSGLYPRLSLTPESRGK